MLAKVISGTTIGLKSVPVIVEVDISSYSLPLFSVLNTKIIAEDIAKTINDKKCLLDAGELIKAKT